MQATNESLLTRLCREPDHESWRFFHEQYNPVILRYARKLGLKPNQAEDVRQRVYLHLLRAFRTFAYDRRRGLFRNFLLTIVHREVIRFQDELRREEALCLSLLPEDLDDLQPAPAPDPTDAETRRRWRESILEQALADLRRDPDLDRRSFDAYWAYVVENQPAPDVASRFQLAENHLYQIKHRINRRLRVQIHKRIKDSELFVDTDGDPTAWVSRTLPRG